MTENDLQRRLMEIAQKLSDNAYGSIADTRTDSQLSQRSNHGHQQPPGPPRTRQGRGQTGNFQNQGRTSGRHAHDYEHRPENGLGFRDGRGLGDIQRDLAAHKIEMAFRLSAFFVALSLGFTIVNVLQSLL
jgi:hypothetical protein